ncbi:hypothetical protein WN72_09685 [Bradyrhizobium arachidis]|uniref:Uncharacterized protein n=1 Tax=Bradyrhizobium arachidis TaxID=858423 RepID=A0AAE7NI80_9BRAD|nr:hypothetical protein [Bradyrhizobium sp. CCBAU 21360]QOZ66613.1 hypothetical protein WN72_09685 [Bradyrhizobium arachidis]
MGVGARLRLAERFRLGRCPDHSNAAGWHILTQLRDFDLPSGAKSDEGVRKELLQNTESSADATGAIKK